VLESARKGGVINDTRKDPSIELGGAKVTVRGNEGKKKIKNQNASEWVTRGVELAKRGGMVREELITKRENIQYAEMGGTRVCGNRAKGKHIEKGCQTGKKKKKGTGPTDPKL